MASKLSGNFTIFPVISVSCIYTFFVNLLFKWQKAVVYERPWKRKDTAARESRLKNIFVIRHKKITITQVTSRKCENCAAQVKTIVLSISVKQLWKNERKKIQCRMWLQLKDEGWWIFFFKVNYTYFLPVWIKNNSAQPQWYLMERRASQLSPGNPRVPWLIFHMWNTR